MRTCALKYYVLALSMNVADINISTNIHKYLCVHLLVLIKQDKHEKSKGMQFVLFCQFLLNTL